MDTKTRNKISSEWIYISYEQVDTEMLRDMIEEFIAPEWASLADDGYFPEDKVGQILERLKDGKFKIVFELISGAASIVEVN